MKLGCHAVLFKEKIKSDPDLVLAGYAALGYEGVEIGSRFYGVEDKEKLVSLLDYYHIALSAMHVGSPIVSWIDKGKENAQKTIDVASFVSTFPNKNVLMSGNREGFDRDAPFVEIAKQMEETAQRCLDLGVQLHYHNHDHEFFENGRVFHILLEHAPSLYFGLDLGWAYVGGYDPIKALEEAKGRVSYVHLRDVYDVGVRDFPALGDGKIGMQAVLDKAEETVGKEGWGVVEFDHGESLMSRAREAKDYLDAWKGCRA